MRFSNKLMVTVASLLLLLSASLLWFKISLNSDSLFLESLSKDLFDLGGSWSDWKLTPAPAYFPDMLLYFFAYKLLPNAFDRIFFVSVGQIFLLALTVIWVSKQIYPKVSGGASASLLLIITAATFVSSRSGMWLYFYTTNNHFASLLLSLLCVGLSLRLYTKPSLWSAACVFLVNIIATASTSIYLISFLIPAILLMFLLLIVVARSQRPAGIYVGRIMFILLTFIVSMWTAFKVQAILAGNSSLKGRVPITFESAGNSFKLFLQATVNSFSLTNEYTFFFSVLILMSFFLLSFSLLRSIKLKEEGIFFERLGGDIGSWRLAIVVALLFVVIPVNFFGAVISGGFIDLSGYRYFSFPLALILILTVIVLDGGGFFSSKWWKIFFLIISVAMVVFFVRALKSSSAPSSSSSVGNCLIDIEKEGFNLKSGIGDYWNARGNIEYLPHHNWILAVVGDGTPYFWMSSIGPVRQPDKYKYQYNFAVLYNSNVGDQFAFTPMTIGKLLPSPSKIHKCTQANLQIWLYEGNALDVFVKDKFDRFMKSVSVRN